MNQQTLTSPRSCQSGTRPRHWQNVWRDWRWFMVVLAGLLITRSIVADWNQVPTGSMQPTIAVGDQIVVDKRAYDLRLPFTQVRLATWAHPRRGDIVTFPSPLDGRLYVKRVVAQAGDVVAMRNNVLSVNGISATYILQSDNADSPYRTFEEHLLGSSRLVQVRKVPHPGTMTSFGPITVPAGAYLMLGDNRDESFDSRALGTIDRTTILGRARAVAFSLDYGNDFQPRPDRALAALR